MQKKKGLGSRKILVDLIAPLLEQSLNEFKEALILDPENDKIKRNFNEVCQKLDSIKNLE